jgi:hypothetical protein
MADVNLEMVQALVQNVLHEQKETRREIGDIRGLVLALNKV